jgi:hypothetical protein
MADLRTTYMGLELRTPLVASASPLSHEIDTIRQLEDAGASAVVLYSLFEEQLRHDELELDYYMNADTDSFAEATSFFPQTGEFRLGPEGYLNHIRKAKAAVSVPIIASLNGSTVGGWTEYARKIEQAGADALECNIYFLATDPEVSSSEIEKRYIDILKAVKSAVTIPVALKISPFFSNMANMAKRDRTQRSAQHSASVAASANLDWHSLRPDSREPCSYQRCARAGRRDQTADGGGRRHHAVFRTAAQWNWASPTCRTRRAGMAGCARIRIGGADEGRYEPVTLWRSFRVRTRTIYEGGEERAARQGVGPRSVEDSGGELDLPPPGRLQRCLRKSAGDSLSSNDSKKSPCEIT